MEDKSGLYIVGIVGLVAVVALVVIISGGSKGVAYIQASTATANPVGQVANGAVIKCGSPFITTDGTCDHACQLGSAPSCNGAGAPNAGGSSGGCPGTNGGSEVDGLKCCQCFRYVDGIPY
jgi:hypothetical protein